MFKRNCCGADKYVDPVNVYVMKKGRDADKDDKDVMVRFKSRVFMRWIVHEQWACAESQWLIMVYVVSGVSKVCDVECSPCRYRKCRLGCLIVLGDTV